MADALAETTAVEDAALWQVDLADIAKQVDLPTDVLLDALITSTANAPGAPPGPYEAQHARPDSQTSVPGTLPLDEASPFLVSEPSAPPPPPPPAAPVQLDAATGAVIFSLPTASAAPAAAAATLSAAVAASPSHRSHPATPAHSSPLSSPRRASGEPPSPPHSPLPRPASPTRFSNPLVDTAAAAASTTPALVSRPLSLADLSAWHSLHAEASVPSTPRRPPPHRPPRRSMHTARHSAAHSVSTAYKGSVTQRSQHAAAGGDGGGASEAGVTAPRGVFGMLSAALQPSVQHVDLVSEVVEIPLAPMLHDAPPAAASLRAQPSFGGGHATEGGGDLAFDTIVGSLARTNPLADLPDEPNTLYMLTVDPPAAAAPPDADGDGMFFDFESEAAAPGGGGGGGGAAYSNTPTPAAAFSDLAPPSSAAALAAPTAQTYMIALPGVLEGEGGDAAAAALASAAAAPSRASFDRFPSASAKLSRRFEPSPIRDDSAALPLLAPSERPSMLPEAVEGVLDYTLPTDVVDVHVERGGTKQHPELDIRVERKLPTAAYVLLAGSVACASMYDISMQLLQPGGAGLKRAWRGMAAFICCVPWVAVTFMRQREALLAALQDRNLCITALLSGLGGAAFSGCYIYALRYTSLADAFLLTNGHSIAFLLAAAAREFSVEPLKLVGTVVCTAGAWLTTFDPGEAGQSAKPPQGDVVVWGTPVPSRLVGDVIALCGAAGGVLTIVAAARRRGELVLSAFTALMTAATVPVFLAASALLDTPPPAATFSPRDGVLGLLAPSHWLGDLVAGPLSAILGSVGYVAALKYFDPLVMATVMLSDQIIGNFFFRLVFRFAPPPRHVTLLGTAVSIAGVAAMVLASRARITHFNIRLRQNP